MTDTVTKPKAKPGVGKRTPDDGLTQSERFIKAAQELGTDDNPERFAERVRKLAKVPPPKGDT
ncbi:hypothetical protein HNR00_001026 [Methylorubrum rhodinum]|uniref:Uncharacterized protein n=1 Tax=Methylorubrum rhodinum TaxID=29428 RepID=A0A840ZGM3_9HYPH|nr:hypothetical protein [Methylorubrum rhodinum]MBB5756328.1 hypothetical protein [Methylorubrum rhodinum]